MSANHAYNFSGFRDRQELFSTINRMYQPPSDEQVADVLAWLNEQAPGTMVKYEGLEATYPVYMAKELKSRQVQARVLAAGIQVALAKLGRAS